MFNWSHDLRGIARVEGGRLIKLATGTIITMGCILGWNEYITEMLYHEFMCIIIILLYNIAIVPCPKHLPKDNATNRHRKTVPILHTKLQYPSIGRINNLHPCYTSRSQ